MIFTLCIIKIYTFILYPIIKLPYCTFPNKIIYTLVHSWHKKIGLAKLERKHCYIRGQQNRETQSMIFRASECSLYKPNIFILNLRKVSNMKPFSGIWKHKILCNEGSFSVIIFLQLWLPIEPKLSQLYAYFGTHQVRIPVFGSYLKYTPTQSADPIWHVRAPTYQPNITKIWFNYRWLKT